jgi:SAM-dependent methyltransferase
MVIPWRHLSHVRGAKDWQATKITPYGDGWRACRDPNEVFPGSRWYVDLATETLVPMLELYAEGDLLDLGCGKVPYYGVYGPRTSSVVCLDWPSSLHNGPYVDVFADLTRELPFRSLSFDTVLLADVLEHVPDPSRVLSEAARLLRPDGNLLVSVPFFYWLHEEPHDYCRYTEFRLRTLCLEAGFDEPRIVSFGGEKAVVVDLLSRMLSAGRWKPRVRDTMIRWARSRPYLGDSFRYPLGYVLWARRSD